MIRAAPLLLLAAAAPQPARLPQTATLPAWEARMVIPAPVEVKAQSVTVRPGDTLGGIARRTGSGEGAIAHANRLADTRVVRTGQRLRIPAGRYHRIGRGESGIAIARGYGVEWHRVAELNGLAEPFVLREGQRLLLPSPREVANLGLEARAAAFRLDIDDLVTGSEPAVAAGAMPVRPVRTATRTPAPTVPVAVPDRFSGGFAWPLKGRILRPFGQLGSGQRNDGVNIAAEAGAAVDAAADGVVAYAGNGIAAYGGLILIRHGEGWLTAYGHAEALLVKRGQAVKRGQRIARAGDTGFVSEPQLHFEVRHKRQPVDPLGVLPRG